MCYNYYVHRVLKGIINSKRIASAFLFVGPPDSSKSEDAQAFADELGCSKFDLVRVKPDGAYIKIEQVRDLQGRVRYGPSTGDYFAVIIERADQMTPEAAGAFLKTLEEPPKGVVFILLIEREDRVPLTIVSRCQRIVFGEKFVQWTPKPEFDAFYSDLKEIKKKSVLELFELSARLEKEKERIETLLYDLVAFAKEELKDLKLVRVLLDAAANIKKRASLKLALDLACLRMGEA